MKALSLICSLAILIGALGCQKDEVEPVSNISQLLNGQYSGKITYVTYIWTGKEDTLFRKTTSDINFKLEGSKFHRPECGDCSGTLAINTNSNTVVFNSSDKACSDKGSDATGSWSFTNGIMGDYTFTLVNHELTLIQKYPRPKDMGVGSAYHTEKIIIATGQGL